jgi:hypothetical protein
MDNSETELLSVSVSSPGAAQIKRLFTSTKWMFRVGILNSLLAVTGSLFRLSYSHPDRYRNIPSYYWESKLYVGHLLYYLFFIAQLVLYLRFVRRMNQTLENRDNDGFNESFDFLYRSNQWALCGMLVATFYALLNIWVTWSAAVAALHRG